MSEKLVHTDNFNILRFLYTIQAYKSGYFYFQNGVQGQELFLRNINLFSKDLAWSPVDAIEKLAIEMDIPLLFKDKLERLSFETEALHIHGKKMLVSRFPTAVEILNTRESQRIDCHREKVNPLKFFNVSDVNYQGNPTQVSGELMDFSPKGVAIKVLRETLTNVKVGDQIQLQLHEEKSFLQKLIGRVMNFSKAGSVGEKPGFIRLGVELEKSLSIDKCKEVFL